MKPNIAVVFGGESVEHDISIITGIQTLNAINKQKYNVIPLYIDKVGRWLTSSDFFSVENFLDKNKMKKAKEISFVCGSKHVFLKTKIGLRKWMCLDSVVLCCHGGNGENGAIQGFFEVLGFPYTSPDVISSAICMDKILSKKVLKESGISVVDYTVFTKQEYENNFKTCLKKVEGNLSFPVILKPAKLGSSIGITVCKNKKQFKEGLELGFKFDKNVLVEKFVEDLKEVNVSVLSCDDFCYLSKIETPTFKKEIFSFEDKYLSTNKKTASKTNTKKVVLADIDKETENKILKIAKKASEVLNIKGLIRIDFIIDKKTGDIYLNELNTIPGSLANYLWEGRFDFPKLIDKMIESAKINFENDKKYIKSFESSVLEKNKFSKLKV